MKPTDQTRLIVESIKREQVSLREKMELVLLRDLVQKLDPNHNYIFDAKTMVFNKTPIAVEESPKPELVPAPTGLPPGMPPPTGGGLGGL